MRTCVVKGMRLAKFAISRMAIPAAHLTANVKSVDASVSRVLRINDGDTVYLQKVHPSGEGMKSVISTLVGSDPNKEEGFHTKVLPR